MKTRIPLLFTLLLRVSDATPQQASAPSYIDGNKLLGFLSSPAMEPVGTGFVMGVYDTFSDLQLLGRLKPAICVPRGVTIKQLADITLKHLQDNPAQRHTSASALTWVALRQAFPCK
jgi:hypothetical protein